jgi:AraC-like DNA-binding protein
MEEAAANLPGGCVVTAPDHSLLPHLTFDTAALPVAQQFEALAATVGVTHDVAPLADPPAAGFAASAEIWMLNQTVVSRSRFDPLLFCRPPARARRDGVDHYTLLFTEQGQWDARADGPDQRVAEGELCLLDLARPLESRTGAVSSLCLLIPRPRLDALLPAGNWHGVMPRGAAGMLLRAYLQALTPRLAAMSVVEARDVEQATLHLVAAAMAPSAMAPARDAPAVAAGLLATARARIEARLADPTLSPDSLAAELGLSRASLYRLFAPMGGVRAFIQGRRLARVRARLADPRPVRRLADVAFGCGFASESHFSREFRARFGQTPREARAEALRGPGLAATAGYHSWLGG